MVDLQSPRALRLTVVSWLCLQVYCRIERFHEWLWISIEEELLGRLKGYFNIECKSA